jgi:hypothetical protein
LKAALVAGLMHFWHLVRSCPDIYNLMVKLTIALTRGYATTPCTAVRRGTSFYEIVVKS